MFFGPSPPIPFTWATTCATSPIINMKKWTQIISQRLFKYHHLGQSLQSIETKQPFRLTNVPYVEVMINLNVTVNPNPVFTKPKWSFTLFGSHTSSKQSVTGHFTHVCVCVNTKHPKTQKAKYTKCTMQWRGNKKNCTEFQV